MNYMNLFRSQLFLVVILTVLNIVTSFEKEECNMDVKPMFKNVKKMFTKQTLKEHSGFIEALSHFETGNFQYLISGSYNEKSIKIWNASDSESVKVLATLPTSFRLFSVIPFQMGDSKYLASGGYGSNDILVWNLENNLQNYNLTGHSGYVKSFVTYESNGKKYLLSGSQDKTIKLWDLASKTCLYTFEGCIIESLFTQCKGHSSAPTSLDIYEEDGKIILVSGSLDNKIKLWDLDKKSLITTLTGHKKSVSSVRVFHKENEPYLVSGSEDSTIKIWNLNHSKLETTLAGHAKAINSLTLIPLDNKLCLVSGSSDKTIKFWDLDNYDLINSVNVPSTPRSFTTFQIGNVPYLVSGHGRAHAGTGKGLGDGEIMIWSDDE